MSTLTHTLKVSASWINRESLDLASFSDQGEISYSKDIASGTGVDQCDRSWSDTRTLGSSSNDDLDLTALTSSVFGDSITTNFAKVKEIVIVVLSTTTGDKLKLDSSVTNAYLGPFDSSTTSKLVIGPDSPCVLSNKKDGFGATSGTNKVLRINNPGATSVQYQIFISGTSA